VLDLRRSIGYALVPHFTHVSVAIFVQFCVLCALFSLNRSVVRISGSKHVLKWSGETGTGSGTLEVPYDLSRTEGIYLRCDTENSATATLYQTPMYRPCCHLLMTIFYMGQFNSSKTSIFHYMYAFGIPRSLALIHGRDKAPQWRQREPCAKAWSTFSKYGLSLDLGFPCSSTIPFFTLTL
jgi:hypothetical protein